MQAAGQSPRRLFAFNAGFWTKPRLHRILTLAGWNLRMGLPGKGDAIAIWGASPTAWRGQAMARRRGVPLVRIEDAFLRSVLPGRARGPVAARGPVGLLIDPLGIHFDASAPSLIEHLAQGDQARALSSRASAGIERLRKADLSKYNAHLPDLPAPEPGYVLVIDQTRGDASLMGAGRARFVQMLQAARAEHPDRRIVIRSHPETAAGLRAGHFTTDDLQGDDAFSDTPLSPWRLVEGAAAVYAVSSQLGYEAMLAGHRPRLFGQPFYAGWGLSQDELPVSRRGTATAETLFAASHLLAPLWYDPCRDRLCDFETVCDQIEAEARAWRQDHAGHLAYGMRLWKRAPMARFFGSGRGARFTNKPSDQVTLVWANRAGEVPQAARVEDGFLRSRGLGAELVPPLSLVTDDLGIYYDPQRESRLEKLIARPVTPQESARAEALIARIVAGGITKYNRGATPVLPDHDGRRRILVPGQVEDDASIIFGAGDERDNLALLRRVRAENPDALLIWKPHPDVEAGLRLGSIPAEALLGLADLTLPGTDPGALLGMVDEVWTITSTLGFEALLRGVPVTTLGAPFYAGWGLSRDLGPVPARRQARPGLAGLVHAVLIAYPRYFDPISGLPCPAEVALDRLSDPAFMARGPGLRWLAKAQGALAGHSWIWRR